MAMTNDQKKDALTKVEAAILDRRAEFVKLLPKGWTVDRFVAQARVAVAKTPKLLTVAPASVVMALYQCAELGLTPGGGLGHGWIVPYGANAQWVTGYKGLIYLATKARVVMSVRPVCVYQHEVDAGKFVHDEGQARNLVHKVVPLADDALDPVLHAAYVSMLLADGQRDFHIMYRRQILKRRERSAGYKSAIQYKKDHPWITDFDPMAMKTVIRDALKSVPASSEAEWGERLAKAFSHEDSEDADFEPVEEEDQQPAPKSGMDQFHRQLAAQGSGMTLEQAMRAPTEREMVSVASRPTTGATWPAGANIREPGSDDGEYTPAEPPADVNLPSSK